MRNSLSSSIRRVNVLYRRRTWYQSIRNLIDLTVVVGTRRRLPSLENILLFIINYYIVLWALETEVKKKNNMWNDLQCIHKYIYIYFCFRSETKARPKLYTVEGLVFLQRIFSFEGDTCHVWHTPHCSIILLIIYRQYDLYSDSYIYIHGQ